MHRRLPGHGAGRLAWGCMRLSPAGAGAIGLELELHRAVELSRFHPSPWAGSSFTHWPATRKCQTACLPCWLLLIGPVDPSEDSASEAGTRACCVLRAACCVMRGRSRSMTCTTVARLDAGFTCMPLPCMAAWPPQSSSSHQSSSSSAAFQLAAGVPACMA